MKGVSGMMCLGDGDDQNSHWLSFLRDKRMRDNHDASCLGGKSSSNKSLEESTVNF